MKIEDVSIVDYTKPGLQWDGTTLWAVGSDGMGWSMGANRSAFEFLEEPDEPDFDAQPEQQLTLEAVSNSGVGFVEATEAMTRLAIALRK